MFRLLIFPLLLTLAVVAAPPKSAPGVTHWVGTISNGMKGDKISFDVSADGKQLSNLTMQGYWRCSGKLEMTTQGPAQAFAIQGGQVHGVAVEPPTGGSTAWRFALDGTISKTSASGTYRSNINNLGCDTYALKWTAAPAAKAGVPRK